MSIVRFFSFFIYFHKKWGAGLPGIKITKYVLQCISLACKYVLIHVRTIPIILMWVFVFSNNWGITKKNRTRYQKIVWNSFAFYNILIHSGNKIHRVLPNISRTRGGPSCKERSRKSGNRGWF